MMTKASTTLIWFSLTIFVSLGLYRTSYRVEELDRQLRTLNSEIEAEQRNIHVLKAEWVYLANPARIEEAAKKHLNLQPTAPRQVSQIGKISSLVPTHQEAAALQAKETRAVATLTPHPAARAPKVAASETGRLNTRLVFQQAQATQTATADPLAFARGGEQ